MSGWTYHQNTGPVTWESKYEAAKGKRQSPINIIDSQTKFDHSLINSPLTITMDKCKMENQQIIFTGHNFRVNTPDFPSVVTGGPTNDVYKLAQYHFHWGQTDDSVGSGHQIDGNWWPSELHLVHYNTTKYESERQSADKPDGFLVLSIFLQIGDNNPEIEKLMSFMPLIKNEKSIDFKTHGCLVDIQHLLPQDTSRYYAYPGSLTTPPCYESVTWVVFPQPITIGSNQLRQFRQVHDGDGCETSANFRPVCPIHERVVLKSFN